MKSLGDKRYNVPFIPAEIWVSFHVAYNFRKKVCCVNPVTLSLYTFQVSTVTEWSDVPPVHPLPQILRFIFLFIYLH